MSDTADSPRPLRDPCAPRPEGSSIHGFYGKDAGKRFQTWSVQAVRGDDDRNDQRSDDDRIEGSRVQVGGSNPASGG